ncbi:unnamed protein product [Prorocentrum cordatum]|uniref:WKF domain-containing protein n=1 Tax=Prorocentrum cordatum TaxID=2364126 RepID=A0ABN9XXH2_9DINO|nr:unnamed protein product [Polarella glacialis]
MTRRGPPRTRGAPAPSEAATGAAEPGSPGAEKAKGRAKAPKKRKKAAEESRPRKDPDDAEAYLKAWAASRDGSGGAGWRFNKATQAWLLRHAYDPERVSKGGFQLLLPYLEGLRGAARERARSDATAVVEANGGLPAAAATDKEARAPEGKLEAREAKKTKKRKAEGAELAAADGEADRGKAAADADALSPKERAARLRRARKVAAALGGEAEGAAEGGADHAAVARIWPNILS